MVEHPTFNQNIMKFLWTLFICVQRQLRIPVETQISGLLLILCHQRHDFQLKIHHKAFGGQRSPDSLAGFKGEPQTGRRGKRKGKKGRGGECREKEGRGGSPHICKQITAIPLPRQLLKWDEEICTFLQDNYAWRTTCRKFLATPLPGTVLRDRVLHTNVFRCYLSLSPPTCTHQHTYSFIIPRMKTNCTDRSFSVNGSGVWNSLPDDLR